MADEITYSTGWPIKLIKARIEQRAELIKTRILRQGHLLEVIKEGYDLLYNFDKLILGTPAYEPVELRRLENGKEQMYRKIYRFEEELKKLDQEIGQLLEEIINLDIERGVE